jgi:hypothetical protein
MSITSLKKNINEEFVKAKREIETDCDEMLKLIDDIKSGGHDEIREFVEQVFEWRKDGEKDQWLWEIFREVVDFNQKEFLSSFRSFVGNFLLDDSYFRIEWRRAFISSEGFLEWLPDGNYRTEIVDKSADRAFPIVIPDYSDSGSQNVSLIKEAMDHKFLEKERRDAWLEEEGLF